MTFKNVSSTVVNNYRIIFQLQTLEKENEPDRHTLDIRPWN